MTAPLYIYSYRHFWASGEDKPDFLIFDEPLSHPEVGDLIDELESEMSCHSGYRGVSEFRAASPSEIPPEWLDERIERMESALERYKKLKEWIQ